jgi:lipopolysaccharide transport system ATP-binding protein
MSEKEVVVSVENISKKFSRDLMTSLYYGAKDIANECLAKERKSNVLRKKEFWALKNISFKLHKGDSLGLVGPNGCGKTTTLKLIAGLLKPDTGVIKVKGRVASLISLGVGFSGILTARENIYTNMTLLGLTKKQIDERFDDIVKFAELEHVVDTPLKTFSSGMHARLGFACAVHTDPDVLLIDEILAVGDVQFRMKCHRRLAELRKKGVAFIMVSHNASSLLSACDNAVYLSNGKVVMKGKIQNVMRKYEEYLFVRINEKKNIRMGLAAPEKEYENKNLKILSIYFRNQKGIKVNKIFNGSAISLCFKAKVDADLQNVNVEITIKERVGESDFALRLNTATDLKSFNLEKGEYEIKLNMPYLVLRPGNYALEVRLTKDKLYDLDTVTAFYFSVRPGRGTAICQVYQPRKWEIIRQ